MGENSKSFREEIIREAAGQYRCTPEHLWAKYPEYAVLRRQDNQKWFAVFMDVARNKLGLDGEERVYILDLKADPEMAGMLTGMPGYFPGYHMHKGNWITVLLDGTVDREAILSLLDISYTLAGGSKKGNTSGRIITDWIIPANPKIYDIQGQLKRDPKAPFLWKQSSNIRAGNIVYLYLAAPVRAILYKCKVLEADIPHRYEDKNLTISRAMRLQLLEQYDEGFLTMDRLKEHGVYAVRGPRSMPKSLIREINMR